MFYAVTDLLTIATIWTWVESLQFNPFMPTQPNPWVDPTHVHVCVGILLADNDGCRLGRQQRIL